MAKHSAIDQDYMQSIFWHMRYTQHIATKFRKILDKILLWNTKLDL